ncbi:MAG: cell division protein ZapA [bacterium]
MALIKAKIFGQEYTIKGNADPQYIHKIADYVDKKMQEVAKQTSITSLNKIAILTAINIAYEYYELIKPHQKQIDKIKTMEKKVLNIIKKIDNTILQSEIKCCKLPDSK